MKCLVTGGAGFIGSHLVHGLLKRGHEVRVLDNFVSGKRQNVQHLPIDLVEGDIRDHKDLQGALRGAQHVYHLAALGSVARSVEDPLSTHSVNETGTLMVLDGAQKAKAQRVVLASSSSVYGNIPTLPKRESAKPAPASPYAVSKLTGEYYCNVFWNTYDLETVCLRYFNVFGPRQDPESEYAAVIPRFIQALLAGENPVIYGDGTQTRDFTYVANVVEATMQAMHTPKAAGQIANIACGERWSLLELVKLLGQVFDIHVTPEFRDERVGDVKHSQAAIIRAQRVLGYAPRISFQRGLRETVEWFRYMHQEMVERQPARRVDIPVARPAAM
ncbi:MAG: SDR family oxidoreductase [Xanthomonadaceae bacterium]|nr:SDR family oxidoreductase [Xanthomonadaceae bacterium]